MTIKKFHLTEDQKAIAYMVAGVLILLYAFNFFDRWLNTLVILIALGLIGYGFVKIGGVDYIRQLLAKTKK